MHPALGCSAPSSAESLTGTISGESLTGTMVLSGEGGTYNLPVQGTITYDTIITGISGVMLNEGRKRDFDVITLLAQARHDMPDARAAAMLIERISKIIRIKIDIEPLSARLRE